MQFLYKQQPAPAHGGFQMEDWWVWCGCPVKADGKYHLFASRWPKCYPFFEGYKIASEIVRAQSDNPGGPYEFKEVVLGDRGEEYWDGRMTHNPTILEWNGKYLLYYIGSTYHGSRPTPEQLLSGPITKPDECYANIRIGVAISDSVNGPWKRLDEPILVPRENKWDSSIVTNPAPCLSGDRIYLYYRSNTPEGLRIGAAVADSPKGPYTRLCDEPVLRFENGGHVEDPFVWHDGEQFCMLAKDMTGSISGEKHAGIFASSVNGMDWTPGDPPKAYSRQINWSDGKVATQGSLERPSLLFEDGKPTWLFAATGDGPGGFQNALNTWNIAIPLSHIV